MDDGSVEQEALTILKKLSEDQLRDEIVIPLFRHKGLKVEVIDENREVDHGCDLLLESRGQGERILVGVQLKVRENVSTRSYVKKNIQRCARDGFGFRFGKDGHGRLARFRWITTGKITDIGETFIREELQEPDDIGGKVEVWDIKKLYEELRESGAIQEIGVLKILDAKLRAEEHSKAGEYVFAAHYWCRAGRWYLSERNCNPQAAKEAFDRATHLLKEDPRKSIYYHRTLIRYSEMWSQLAGRWQEVDPRAGDHLVDIAQSPRAKAIMTERYPEDLIPLLQDAESIFQELEILQELQFVRYASLELLQITRLLLRAGYPPSLPGIQERFEQIAREFKDENWQSLDGECSLCTSCAVSCFALANRGPEVLLGVQWLKGLGNDRYVHRRSVNRNPGEHSLHYTAAVLLAFLDSGEGEDIIEEVLAIFFRSRDADHHGFYREWMRYRSEDRFWVSRHILTAFLQVILSGRVLEEERATFLCQALEAMIVNLKEEALEAQVSYFYPTRENLGSFSLGLVLGSAESGIMARKVVGILRERAEETVRSQKKDRQELWDSSIDRTPILVEGLLQYWETILYLEEQGLGVPELPTAAAAL